METRDLDRIRFVTRHFQDLQGLRHLVPAGLLLLSGAGMASLASWPRVLLPAALLLGAFLLTFGASRYYRSTFGEVEPPRLRPVAELSPLSIFSTAGPVPRLEPLQPGARFGLILGLFAAVFVLFQFLYWPPWIGMDSEVIVDPTWHEVLISFSSLQSVAPMIYPLFGSFFLAIWWLRGHRISQSYHLGIGILLAALPVVGPRATPLWVALLLCGSSMILAGLLDHWQLVRTLGRPSQEGD